MIAGLVSTFREGLLGEGAVRSLLPAVDFVLVLDAPIRGAGEGGRATNWQAFRKRHDVIVQTYAQPFDDDAAKRTWLLQAAQRKRADWAVIVDGDELLLHGEHLPALIERGEEEENEKGAPIVGMPLRIVEVDGSVAMLATRILRVAAFKRYLVSSTVLEAHDGRRVQQGNVKLCGAGGMPVPMEVDHEPTVAEIERYLAHHRPPAGAEPHLYHRSLYRSRSRTIERQHVAEARAFESL